MEIENKNGSFFPLINIISICNTCVATMGLGIYSILTATGFLFVDFPLIAPISGPYIRNARYTSCADTGQFIIPPEFIKSITSLFEALPNLVIRSFAIFAVSTSRLLYLASFSATVWIL